MPSRKSFPHRPRFRWAALVALPLLVTSGVCWGTNAAFQDFFFSVCANPTAALAARCAETGGGLGDLSGDSESSLNPSQTLSSGDAAALAAQQRTQELRERLRTRREDQGAPASSARVELGPYSLLLNARTGSSERDRVVDADAERGYELDERGAEIGLDYRASDALVLGAWLQWGTSELDFDREIAGINFTPQADAGRVDTDRVGLTAYLSATLGERAYLDASAGYNRLQLDVTRNAVFQESARVVPQTNSVTAGDTDGEEWLFTVGAGYQGELGAWSVTPFAGLTFLATDFDTYREADLSATGLALDVSLAEQRALYGQLGVTATRALSMKGWVLLPQLRVEYLAELDRDRSESSVGFVDDAGGNTFRLRGDSDGSDRLDVTVGFVGLLPNGWMPFVEYQFSTLNDDLERYQLSAGLRIELP